MIVVDGVDVSFGTRRLLRGASMRIGGRDRIALVGPNGSGKTTLLETIAGLRTPDGGRVERAGDVTVGYLAQETDELRGRTVLEEVLSAAAAMQQAGHRLQVLERELAEAEGAEREDLLEAYARLQGRFDDLGGHTIEAEARRILGGLGFDAPDAERPTDELSGGWLVRVALAKLLLTAPDVLLLDEPTNHLDLDSVEWLERFLASYEGSILLVSHDRDFMNDLVGKVVEIEEGRLIAYTGDFEAFVAKREARREQLEAAAKQQAKEVAKTQAFIDRFRYKASKARQVQSRVKSLEKLERVEVPTERRRKMGVGFPTPPRAGRVVVSLDEVDFAYGDRAVYRGLSLVLERGTKAALVGPNGAGKTTLLKLLAGALTPDAGARRLGHNVAVGYFAQHAIEALDPDNRVIEEMRRSIPPSVDVRARDLLGRFLFSGDDVDKPVSVLSGGERTRLAMAKLLVEPVNLLCLDEPTNHLDMPSRDVLEDALVGYEGTLVLITHDRHLIRSVANAVVEVRDGGATLFEGDYEAFLYRKAQEEDEGEEPSDAPSAPQTVSPKERRRARALERERLKEHRDALGRVERELAGAYAESDELQGEMADPDFYTTAEDPAARIRRYEELRRRIRALEAEWAGLTEALEHEPSGS